MGCAWFVLPASVWLDATADTISKISPTRAPTSVTASGACEAGDKVVLIEARSRAMMAAASTLEAKLQ
jgi:hypothetical protein